MSDFLDIVSLGFSGSDLGRGIWIGLLCSLFVSKHLRAWQVGMIAFGLDRIWPFYAMSLHGYKMDTISPAIGASLSAIPADFGYYLVRYLGILGLVYLGYNLRRLLHHLIPEQGRRGRGVLPY